ncbi:MAG: c-type cytochrome [Candidatus Velthaea sp.]
MIALAAAAVLFVAQTSHGQPKPPFTHVNSVRAADPKRAGAVLYALHCIQCHGPTLDGTVNGPSLRNAGAADVDFNLSTGRMPLEVPGTEPMRGPPSMPRADIDALIAYITAHGAGPPIPAVGHANDIPRGRVLYEQNCQPCHGSTGDGAVAGYGWLAPSLKASTRLQTAEAVRVGPGIMPRFGERDIPQNDLDDLSAYVEALHHPDDRGGYSLASAGPVGEGFAGWLIGLGVTTLVMLLVGERLKR